MKPENELTLSFYRDIASIGRSSNVTLIQHIDTGRFFVKKILSQYDATLYRTLLQVHVPGIPEIYHVIEDEEKLIVIEEYINGITLSEYENEHGAFTAMSALQIAMQLCDILQHLHTLSPPVIHRDIKPSNIMISHELKVTLVDFNASKTYDASKTRDTVLMGTADYAAPEQFGFSQSDARTDIYAVGVIINVMLTGKFPKEQLCPKPLSKIVSKCTNIDPDKRYPSARHLSTALKKCAARIASADHSQASGGSRLYHSALPPGFRTHKPWKMILAGAGYLILIFLASTLEVEGNPSAAEIYINRISFFIWTMLVVATGTNYLGFADRLPLRRSSNPFLKVLGFLLWSSIFLIAVIMLMVIIIDFIK
ncbi:MAG: serine/threonine-protein kinase [Bacillota bacterium]|nr:serine/threonine-protein kinase [Bacillota bacterium]